MSVSLTFAASVCTHDAPEDRVPHKSQVRGDEARTTLVARELRDGQSRAHAQKRYT